MSDDGWQRAKRMFSGPGRTVYGLNDYAVLEPFTALELRDMKGGKVIRRNGRDWAWHNPKDGVVARPIEPPAPIAEDHRDDEVAEGDAAATACPNCGKGELMNTNELGTVYKCVDCRALIRPEDIAFADPRAIAFADMAMENTGGKPPAETPEELEAQMNETVTWTAGPPMFPTRAVIFSDDAKARAADSARHAHATAEEFARRAEANGMPGLAAHAREQARIMYGPPADEEGSDMAETNREAYRKIAENSGYTDQHDPATPATPRTLTLAHALERLEALHNNARLVGSATSLLADELLGTAGGGTNKATEKPASLVGQLHHEIDRLEAELGVIFDAANRIARAVGRK
jgi:hypothetical protein